MAITLKEAMALNGTSNLTSFKALQEQCKNPGYFTSSKPINYLSSWEGYTFCDETSSSEYSISASLSQSSVSCSSGTATLTVEVKRKDIATLANCTTSDSGWYFYDTTPTATESASWLSIGAFSKSSTGKYTATVTYNSNGKNTSSRSCEITCTANNKSSKTTLTQAADSYTTGYGNYSTTLSLSKTSGDCASTTATATIKVYRQSRKVWVCGGNDSWSANTLFDTTPTLQSNQTWCTVGAISKSSTGTYTSTISISTNSKNTNSRSATLTASANNKSATASYAQGADSYTDSGGTSTVTYGNWGGGAISFSKAALSAGADSCTVTIQPWSRTKKTTIAAKIRTWVCGGTETITAASSSNTTEYYTGAVTVSENGSYTSLNATSYTASSSAKTLTLTKSTYGTTVVAATTVTVTANPNTDGPGTTTNKVNIVANSATYQAPVVTAFSYPSINWDVLTASPTITVTQNVSYTSKAPDTVNTLTSSQYTASFGYGTGGSSTAASVHSSNGTVTWSSKNESYTSSTNRAPISRTRDITVRVTANGKTSSTYTAVCTQNAFSASVDAYQVASSSSSSPGGGTISVGSYAHFYADIYTPSGSTISMIYWEPKNNSYRGQSGSQYSYRYSMYNDGNYSFDEVTCRIRFTNGIEVKDTVFVSLVKGSSGGGTGGGGDSSDSSSWSLKRDVPESDNIEEADIVEESNNVSVE